MKFHELAHYFDIIEKTSARTEITKQLADLFSHASAPESSIICNVSLGQLNPPHIGTNFAIASTLMTGIIAQLLDVSESTVHNHAKKVGDLGTIVETEYRNKPTQELTVTQVYKALHVIEQLSGTGSQEEKRVALLALLGALDPLSAKYVVRIILAKLRLGFSDMTLIDALSWMEAGDKSLRATIENAYNICADIGFIAQTLKEHGVAALEAMHIQLGIPIRPAAAERLPTAAAIVEKIGPCIAQPKLDGFRLQIHLDKRGAQPLVRFFSRNLVDMSYMFPDLMAAVIQLPVKTLICEGEAIVYDRNTGSFMPFQETVKRKRKHDIEEMASELPLQVFIFDLLYLDGKEYLTATHEQRRTALLHVFAKTHPDIIQVIQERIINNAQELEHYFQDTVSLGLEGLVVKKPDSIYQPGKRNFNWIKLKRQETGHVEDTIDCVILGYYAGSGKRAQFGIGAFLVGVYNKKQDRFETIAKIGTGLKDHDWVAIKKQCDAYAVKAQPKNVVCAPDLFPDVWVAPELVVTILADEITQSPVHAAGRTEQHLGYALRFPRYIASRDDKKAEQSTSVDEIKRLYQDQFV